jgi:predicted phage terminase large subunit-like protein
MQELDRRATAEACRTSFFRFLKELWGEIIQEEPVFNWHIEYLCNELQTLLENVIQRKPKLYDLIINIPPGSTKSTICAQMFPAWAWTRDPSLRFITGSYSADLALEHADYTRDIVKSDTFQRLFPDMTIRASKDLKSNYRTSGGGQRFSTSIGGTVTGTHAHVIIVDDPLNPKKAASPVELKNAADWMDRTLSTRKVDKAITPTILIMQRLAQDDCTGMMLGKKGKALKHICLPADDDWPISPPELAERYRDQGGLLDPVRLGRAVLDEAKIDLGSFGYAGQFGQQPRPTEGGLFKLEWWQRYRFIKDPGYIVQSWDTAFKKTKDAAYSVCETWREGRDGYYLIDVWRQKVEYPELKRAVLDQYNKHAPDVVLIEDKASGQSVVQELRRDTRVPLVAITPKSGDKEMRAETVAPLVEAGKCFIPEDGAWVAEFLDELTFFPNAKYKDQVDAFSQAMDHFKNRSRTSTRPATAGASRARQISRGYR